MDLVGEQGDCIGAVFAEPSLQMALFRPIAERTMRKEGRFAPLVGKNWPDAIALGWGSR